MDRTTHDGTTTSSYGVAGLNSDLIDLNIRPRYINKPLRFTSPLTLKDVLRGETQDRFRRKFFEDKDVSTISRWLNHDTEMDASTCARFVDAVARLWNLQDTGNAEMDKYGAGIEVTRRRVLAALLDGYSHNESLAARTSRVKTIEATCQILAYVAAEVGLRQADAIAIGKSVCDSLAAIHGEDTIAVKARQLREAIDRADAGVYTAHELQMETRTLLDNLVAHNYLSKEQASILTGCLPPCDIA